MSSSSFIYPNVTSLPQQNGTSSAGGPGSASIKRPGAGPSEFDQVFDKTISDSKEQPDLNQVKAPLKFSAHATQRLKDRKIAIDPMTMSKINDAVDKAEAKGVEDTLILTQDAALIVNVHNRTVITALDRKSASGNVFTNIDGAVIV